MTKTVRVRSTHPESQGEYVVIDAIDYDPTIHVLYEPDAQHPPQSPATVVNAPAEPPAPPAPKRKSRP